ncbi:hypothetical protein [Mycolicibacter senuensis]|uniref:Uncharacterized protein n=1 Tax=Mycolicibacter senuensis TaxID=386913 RepID=A0A7I9XPK2_9MYCO|nr:hypothetical protein [Mycolicibacter senuensis]ORW69687.1 hypothetical protein AWC24_04665 [Mycolicibacter senuensis]GFG71844.1 hypothetical protein MSEN_35640 [Mycolicibacter senuensis]
MTSPQRIIVRATVTETGDLLLCTIGRSLLFGVPEDAITPGMEYPKEWHQAGARRVKEAGAHGHVGLVAVLGYWCEQEYPDAELVLIEWES